MSEHAKAILEKGSNNNLAKTRYVNDKQITDHYAIIPTGQGLSALSSLSERETKIYETICRRFLSIFYDPAVYQKVNLQLELGQVNFFASFKVQ